MPIFAATPDTEVLDLAMLLETLTAVSDQLPPTASTIMWRKVTPSDSQSACVLLCERFGAVCHKQ